DNGRFQAVAVLPDGKILAAGTAASPLTGADFLLVRFNSDGSPDMTFGAGGFVFTDFGGTDEAVAMAISPSTGDIALAGFTAAPAPASNERVAVALYTPAGAPESTFGSGGKVVTS